jgi:ABC-type uncharacterized transport system substrate-binding protein
MMRTRFWPGGFIAISVWLTASAAQAHPHVWATMMTELLYAPDGSAVAVRQAWTFDDMYSAFATTGLQAKTKGQFTREELAPGPPVDYWLDYDPKETVLTLHFTLPLKKPVKTKQLTIEIYDPEFFVDFGFAETTAVKLVGAPPQCSVTNEKPTDSNFPVTFQRLDKSFMTSEANIGMGMNFANKISVTCP